MTPCTNASRRWFSTARRTPSREVPARGLWRYSVVPTLMGLVLTLVWGRVNDKAIGFAKKALKLEGEILPRLHRIDELKRESQDSFEELCKLKEEYEERIKNL